jgi:hypothetical protein
VCHSFSLEKKLSVRMVHGGLDVCIDQSKGVLERPRTLGIQCGAAQSMLPLAVYPISPLLASPGFTRRTYLAQVLADSHTMTWV